MKKTTIAMAVAGAMFAAGSAFAEGVTVGGYTAVDWLLTNDADDTQEGQFSVPETEVNFDTENLFVAAGASDSSDFVINQAFVKYAFANGWAMHAGKFDTHLTDDERNAPDREFIQHSLLFDVLADVGGHSMVGARVSGDLGMANVTVGYGNDASVTPGGATDGENSVMLLVNASPMEGLDLELGVLTQDKDGSGVGTLTDINGTYMISGFTVGADFLSGADGDTGEFDNGYGLWAGYDFGNGFGVKARLETASIVDGDDVDATEIQASYAMNDNVAVRVSLHNIDNGTDDFDTGVVQLIGTF